MRDMHDVFITAGSFSFPHVPPQAELEYELELVDFEPVDEVSIINFRSCVQSHHVMLLSVTSASTAERSGKMLSVLGETTDEGEE